MNTPPRERQRPARRHPATSFRPEVQSLEARLVPTGVPPPPGFLFTPVTTLLAMHIHPHLTISMDGQNVTIPAGIGLHPQGDFPIHTHDSSGTLHVESPVLYDFTLDDFFAIWGQPFSNRQVLGFHADATHSISFYVNGQPSTTFGNQILLDHENILIVAGGSGDANQRWVSLVYQDLLHRSAEAASLAAFTFALDAGRVSRYQVVAAVQASPEYRTVETQGLYQQLLGRNANPPELAADLTFLAAGGTRAQLEAALMASQEYFQKRGRNTVTGFLTAIYSDALGRALDPGGQRSGSQALNNGIGPLGLAAAIVGSAEAQALVVKGIFQQYLHRKVDANGLASFVWGLQHGMSADTVLNLVLSSDEFFSHV